MSKSLEACPLWLLFKDHKNWTSSKGTPPPTRPVMGGNGGMNTHLSEIISWLLEPIANSMMKNSSEVISDEDLLNKIDKLNDDNKDWKPETEKSEPIGDSEEMSNKLEEAPGLCGCDDCLGEDMSSRDDQPGASNTNHAGTTNSKEQGKGSSKHTAGGEQTGHYSGSPCSGTEDGISRRNKLSLLLKEKREKLKQKRTNAFNRCDRVCSKDVDQEWVQDMSRPMVVIGSDAVSLFPSMAKLESADEVAEAVLESSMKWDNINWKEATRFLVLGRDEAWCRSSGLYRVLPWRKHKQGSRPGLTGQGPMGAEADDEKQWEFRRGAILTNSDKKKVMAEVLRLCVELMYSTHIYTFGGRYYVQAEGGGTNRLEEHLYSL